MDWRLVPYIPIFTHFSIQTGQCLRASRTAHTSSRLASIVSFLVSGGKAVTHFEAGSILNTPEYEESRQIIQINLDKQGGAAELSQELGEALFLDLAR
jgi:hypothetical protein